MSAASLLLVVAVVAVVVGVWVLVASWVATLLGQAIAAGERREHEHDDDSAGAS